jgi:hypothetical protein
MYSTLARDRHLNTRDTPYKVGLKFQILYHMVVGVEYVSSRRNQTNPSYIGHLRSESLVLLRSPLLPHPRLRDSTKSTVEHHTGMIVIDMLMSFFNNIE